MSKEYFYEDEDGIMKENTRSSSGGLRTLATISIVFSIVIAALIIFVGMVGLKVGNGVGQLTGISAIFVALVVLFYGYVNYVILSAIATFIENSDRSDMVDAIHELTDTIRDGSRYLDEKKRKKKVEERAVETLTRKTDELNREEDIDVELPEIDISGFDKE